MSQGYAGKLVSIDLSSKKIGQEQLPDEEILKQYIGCRGLGLKILYDRLPNGVGPEDPENVLIFMTGPLTGTEVPSPTNTTAVSLNFDTGFTLGRSHSHGFFGSNLKFAGFDGVLITGSSDTPVYLWIHDEHAEIHDASRIWGCDTHETEDAVKKNIGENDASVAAIGPAGENLCHGAIIENDKNHSFSHGGLGGIMGSKKLKAIAVFGTKKLEVERPDALETVAKSWRKRIMENPLRIARGGMARSNYSYYRTNNLVVTKNMSAPSDPEFGKGMSEHKITPRPCYKCPIACSYDVEVKSGPKKGYIASLSGGGENLEGSAAACGINESGSIFYLTDLCDKIGFNSCVIGTTFGLAIECFQRGLINIKDTQGLELKWGSVEVVEKLIQMTLNREGWLGDSMALGAKKLAEIIGQDATKFVNHIKGAAPNMHDWRSQWGTLLGQCVGTGSGWPAPSADVRAEPDLGYKEPEDWLNYRTKPRAVRQTGMIKAWRDSIGTCWFSTWGLPGAISFSTEAVSATTGWKITKKEALEVGERILNLERAFNIKRGLKPTDDFEIGERLFDPPLSGVAAGKSIKPYLEGMVRQYYRLMGWDDKTGKPYRGTLKRLSLDKCIEDIW